MIDEEFRQHIGGVGGDIQNDAARLHDFGEFLVDIDRAKRVYAKDRFRIGHRGRKACGVDDVFHFAEACGKLSQLTDAFAAGCVAGLQVGGIAKLRQLLNGLFELLFRTAGKDDDLFLRHEFCGLKAHSAAAAGDDTNVFHDRNLPAFFALYNAFQNVFKRLSHHSGGKKRKKQEKP